MRKTLTLLILLALSESSMAWPPPIEVEITTPTSIEMNITRTPQMPDVTFHADIHPEYLLPDTDFMWWLEIRFNHDALGEITHEVPEEGSYWVHGSGDWTPQWGNLLAGGNVHVYVGAMYYYPDWGYVYDDHDRDGYEIEGINPTQSQIFGIADTVEERAVCWQESGHRQFDGARYTGTGMPVASYAHDGGYGLMQITPANEEQTWNWRRNLQDGVNHLNNCHEDARRYLTYWYDYDEGQGWDWNPHNQYPDRIWDDAFARYNTGRTIYSPNGNHGERNCSANPAGCNYADSVRGYINNPPW